MAQREWHQEHATLEDGTVLQALSEQDQKKFDQLIQHLQEVNHFISSFKDGRGQVPHQKNFEAIFEATQLKQEMTDCRSQRDENTFSIQGSRCNIKFTRAFSENASDRNIDISGVFTWQVSNQIKDRFAVRDIQLQIQGRRETTETTNELITGRETIRAQGTLQQHDQAMQLKMLQSRQGVIREDQLWNGTSSRVISLQSTELNISLKEVLRISQGQIQTQYYLNGLSISAAVANNYFNTLRFYLLF